MVNKEEHKIKFDKLRIELSLEACEYLGGITNGVTIWSIYSELLNLLSQSNGKIVKRGIQIELAPGEIDCSINSLRQKFGIGPKPMTKVISRFVELGLIRITPSKLASIADLVSVVGWSNADGYHELERNSEEQDPVGRDNKSDDEPEDSLPFLNITMMPTNLSQKSSKPQMRVPPKQTVMTNSTAMLTHCIIYTRARLLTKGIPRKHIRQRNRSSQRPMASHSL